MRFTEVSAPLEQRLTDGIAGHVRLVVGASTVLKDRLNETAHDEALVNRTADAAWAAARPGSVPFWLLLFASGVLVAHALFVRRVANRILAEQTSFLDEKEHEE